MPGRALLRERRAILEMQNADRAPRALADCGVIDLSGGKRVRFIDTPHTPHGGDAAVLYEEQSGTLLCGDFFPSSAIPTL